MFSPIPSTPDIKSQEEATLKFWKDREIFQRSTAAHQSGPRYVFYEEPSAAHVKPGMPQMLARVAADVFPRYRAMRGHAVSRRGGWNAHGLPVELSVEKKLALPDKKQIEAYGVAAFNAKCRQAAFDYIHEWEQLTERIGFWFDPKDAYVTFTNDYIESVWWILRQLWDRDWLYQGFEVTAYCPRCGTPLAAREVRLKTEHSGQSLLVRFPLADEADTSLLAWVIAPWTLPANAALAVQPDAAYVKIRRATGESGDAEYLILARDRVDQVMGQEAFEVVEAFTGGSLRGKRYRPLFTFLPPDRPAHYVVPGHFVTTAEGSGLVAVAPAFSAEALQLAEDYDLPVLMTLDAEGRFIEDVTPWRGKLFSEVDPLITHDLADRGLLFGSGTYTQHLSHCGYCQAPILPYARNSWYLKTSPFADRLSALKQSVQPHPSPPSAAGARESEAGRPVASDWVLGRERYWGTPLPIWVCDACGQAHCVGSVQELSELTHQDQSALNLHRPYVDDLTFACPKCQAGHMRRVPELVDDWFDTGAMPAAQWHYPFENRAKFEEHFPAAAACQPSDATPGWTEAVQTVSTLLFDRAATENLVGLGSVVDAAGEPWPPAPANSRQSLELLDTHGADALRWYLYTTVAPEPARRLTVEAVDEAARACQLPLWSLCADFVAFANLTGWTPGQAETPSEAILDRWIISELHRLVQAVTAAYEAYDLPGATRPVERFVDDLVRWYLPRSGRRMREHSTPADRQAAFSTLYTCLTTLTRLIAPAMPFMAEALYRNLVLSADPAQPESVHLADWPTPDPARIDASLDAGMRLTMKLAALGHRAREKGSRKASQPLTEAAFALRSPEEQSALAACASLLADELNVKAVRALNTTAEVATYTLAPRPQALETKHGARAGSIRAALLKLEIEPAARAWLAGQTVTVVADGQDVEVSADEVEVRLTAREGFAVVGEGGYLAALRIALTPDLVREGLAGEFIRRVQRLREAAGVGLADHVLTTYSATPLLAKAIAAFSDRICAETLSAALVAGPAAQSATVAEEAFEGEKVKIGVINRRTL